MIFFYELRKTVRFFLQFRQNQTKWCGYHLAKLAYMSVFWMEGEEIWDAEGEEGYAQISLTKNIIFYFAL